MNATMENIETLTKVFAGARSELAERLTILRDEIETAKRRRIQGLKNSLERVQASHDQLKAAIEESPALFEKPKTRLMHGIRVGFFKQRGKIDVGDVDTCVAALRKLLGDDADAYIKTTEKPVLAALANLPAKDLAKCGITLSDDVDAVMIKPIDSDIDKLIAALISEKELEQVAG